MALTLIMPMAGNGSRFADQGYEDPKPLIEVKGKPMFVQAVENIGLDFEKHVFIVRKEHNITERVKEYYPNAHIVELDALSEGAACSVLTADEYIDDSDSVFISNCDQIIDWDPQGMIDMLDADGAILTFDEPGKDPKWSYAETDATGNVIRVAEKQPISELATTGHYYWKEWSVYKQSAANMIEANDRFNNEFYLCPVFNYTVAMDKTIRTVHVNEMHGIGTPEDLTAWLSL